MNTYEAWQSVRLFIGLLIICLKVLSVWLRSSFIRNHSTLYKNTVKKTLAKILLWINSRESWLFQPLPCSPSSCPEMSAKAQESSTKYLLLTSVLADSMAVLFSQHNIPSCAFCRIIYIVFVCHSALRGWWERAGVNRAWNEDDALLL